MTKIYTIIALLAFIAVASAGTFGECSCKFKDGHVQKFQVSDCKASACYIECRQNAGGVQESCVTKNEDAVQLPGPGTCACGKARYAVASCDSDECFNHCDKMNAGHGICTTKTNALASALASNSAASSSAAISCDKCIAKLADDIPADDAAFICQKVLKCKQAAQTVAPQPTTAAPKAAASSYLQNAAAIKCDACLAKFADLPADDAAKLCTKVLKCQPAAAAAAVAAFAAAAAAPAMWPAFSNFATATSAGVPFSDCSDAGHLLQVTAVALNPNPPQRGQNVAITISGNLASAVGSATAQLTVLAGTFPVLNQNFQLPGASAGPISQTVNIVVPGIAPSGTYTAKGVITSSDGRQLACITANFNL